MNSSKLGASTTNAANNAKTPYGAESIIKSISFRMIELKESKKFLTGATFFSFRRIIPIPKNNAKKITCNIFLLFEAAKKMFDGTISTSACNGPNSCCFAAAFCFAWVSVA